MNARIDHRICWRAIGLVLLSASLSVFAPAFSCTAYAVEEGADNDIVERDSTEGSGAFVGGGLAQDSNDYAGKTAEIRIHRLSKAKTRRRRKNYLDGNGTVCPGITILTTAV